MTIEKELEFATTVGFIDWSNEENVTSDWRAVIDNPKSLKPNVALVATLQPYEVLMLLRRKKRSKEYDPENFEELKRVDEANLVRYSAAFDRLNAVHIVVCKAAVMRRKFHLQPGVMGLSVNGIPIDISISKHIKSTAYLAGLHMRMDVNEPLGVAKRHIGYRMKYYYQLARDLWPALSGHLIPPFVGSESQTQSADFEKYKPEEIISDPMLRLRYLLTFSRPNLIGTEQDVIYSYGILSGSIPVKESRFNLITHDKSHYDLLQTNKKLSKKYLQPKEINERITKTSQGGEIGEYKQFIWGSKSNGLIGRFAGHQLIKEINLLVVAYINVSHKADHSVEPAARNSIHTNSEGEYKLFEITSGDLGKSIKKKAPPLCNYYLKETTSTQEIGCYVVVLSEHLKEITTDEIDKLSNLLHDQQIEEYKQLLDQINQEGTTDNQQ